MSSCNFYKTSKVFFFSMFLKDGDSTSFPRVPVPVLKPLSALFLPTTHRALPVLPAKPGFSYSVSIRHKG